jgi:hypothetical protein
MIPTGRSATLLTLYGGLAAVSAGIGVTAAAMYDDPDKQAMMPMARQRSIASKWRHEPPTNQRSPSARFRNAWRG